MNQIEFETKRKIFHFLGILFPFIYIYLTKPIALVILSLICIVAISLDIYRYRFEKIQYYLLKYLGFIMRENEKNKRGLASTSLMAIGLFLSCLFFSKNITIYSWLILFICDSAAAIIGVRYGKTYIIDGKSFEGSFSFFIIAFLIGIIFYNFSDGGYSFWGLLTASIFSTITEIYSKKFGIDDNFSIPLVAGLFLSIF